MTTQNLSFIYVHLLPGNLHKWVYCPRGTAIMWMSTKYQDVVRPLVTSHYYRKEPFQMDFFYQATLDNTNYNVTKVAVQFYKEIGGIVSAVLLFFHIPNVRLIWQLLKTFLIRNPWDSNSDPQYGCPAWYHWSNEPCVGEEVKYNCRKDFLFAGLPDQAKLLECPLLLFLITQWRTQF